MAADEFKLIDEQVGLFGAVALLVGMSLGMSIFIVPTQMAVAAGPSITTAILLAIVPMVFGVLLLLQLGGAIPVAGGIYVYASRLVGPFWGLLGVTIPVVAIWSYLLFAALGFAEYVAFFADVPTLAPVWLLLGAFLAINYFGIRIATQVQLALVAVLVAGMVTFILFGVADTNTANYTPVFPEELFAGGYAPFFIAVVTLYIPFQGFGMIIEIGEELENPVENIPKVLGIGMTIVAVLSLGIVFALVGAVPWDSPVIGEAAEAGGLATVATTFAPGWAAAFIAVTALIAAATTVNTLFTSYSRTVMRAARDDVVPGTFAAVHDEHRTPYRAIFLLGAPPILLAPLAIYLDGIVAVAAVDWLIVIVVAGTLIAFAIGGVALWNLPKTFPQRYEYSVYKLPMPVLRIVAVGNVVVSLAFMVLVVAGMPSAFATLVGTLGLAYLGYRYRIHRYADEGIDLKERMSLLHKHERIDD